MADEWTKVGRRGKPQHPLRAGLPGSRATQPAELPQLPGDVARTTQQKADQLQRYIDQLLGRLQAVVSKQLQTCAEQAAREYERLSSSEEEHSWSWGETKQLVVLGLGSPEVSQPARVQLAFACLLTKTLMPDQPLQVQACDPVFSEADRTLLQMMDWQVVEPVKLKLHAELPTLFFMPHCETALLDAVIGENRQQLQQIAVFGNSFRKVAQTYRERLRTSACAPKPPEHLLAIVESIAEAAFDDSAVGTTGALNDLSLVLFPLHGTAG